MAENIDRETRAEFEKFELNGITITKNELGRGSYAVVMELEYRGLKCAGKELYKEISETGEKDRVTYAAMRYLEECRLLSNIRHPNIVQFMGICFKERSKYPILVMELLFINLTKCLKRFGILPNEISYSILYDVSLGLAYLHGQTPTVVHRDLSGNNILLDTNMAAKISDLGVARIINKNPLQELAKMPEKLTKTPGTPDFMPPEVMVSNPQYGVAVDVFSLGALMLQIFTAEWPDPKLGPTKVDPDNPKGVIAHSEVDRRQDLIDKISENPLLEVILQCLSNNPEIRPNITEIVEKMKEMMRQYMPTYKIKVEALRKLSHLETLARQLQEKNHTLQEEKTFLNTRLQSIERHLTVESQGTLELKQVADCPVCTLFGQAIVIEGTLFYGGGENDDCRVHFYTPRSNTWTRLRSHSLTRFGLGQMNGKLVTIGGYGAKDRISPLIQSIEMLNRKWKVSKTPMPTARCYPTVISHSVYIIVAGGVVSMKPTTRHTDAVEIYDVATTQWSRARKLPVPGVFINGGIQNECVYMIGGINEAGSRLNTVYTTTMDKLLASQQSPTSTNEAPSTDESIWIKQTHSKLLSPSAFISPQMILTIGGHALPDICTGGIYMYMSTQNSWSYVGNLPIPISTPAVALISSNECYIVGGKDARGQQLNTAYKCKFNLSVLK